MDTSYTTDELKSVHTVLAKLAEPFVRACFDDWRRAQPDRPPRDLYHYCTAQTFHLIATSGVVWASDIRFMNDASEVKYASDFVRCILEEAIEGIEKDDERELMRRVSRTFDLRDMLHVFAFCCSELDDSIPQWVAYGGRRGGIAIGLEFNPAVLQVRDQSGDIMNLPGDYLLKVIYDPDIQRELSKK